MAQLPSASTSVQASAGGVAAGSDLVCIMSPCALNADAKPRLFGKAADAYAKHGYCEGVEYAELHVRGTRKSFLFVPLPIATPGEVSRKNTSGNTGSSVVDVAAGVGGVLGEHDGDVTVISGGIIGTDQIVLGVSLDGGRTRRRVRLGTANSYTPAYVNAVLSFGAGTLTTGDTIITWHGSAPRSDSSGWSSARQNLAAQLKLFRSALLCGDLQNDTEATAFVGEANTYETENQRFTKFRASVLDRLPLARMSQVQVRMTGSPTLTFETTTDTVTRSAGSWSADGFAVGDTIEFDGTSSNDAVHVIESIDSATQITVVGNLVDEGPVSDASAVGTPTLTFAEVGASGDTLTRSRGSWLADGFRIGDVVSFDGTSSNDGLGGVLTNVTATVLTFGSTPADLAAEVIGSFGVTVTAGQTATDWMTAIDAEFAPVDGQKRISLGAGRGRVTNPFSGWYFRRPVSWAASIREYQHDLHRTTWYKDDGPLADWSLLDEENNLAEWDDRVYGGAGCAARFTTFRTWANGPNGPFIALDLTRDTEGSVLSKSHNLDVTNEGCTVVQLKTENIVGRSDFILNDDGTATADSLATVAKDVNEELEARLLTNKLGEGPRATKAVWTPATDDDFTEEEATMHGVLELLLNGTVYHVNTVVRVR